MKYVEPIRDMNQINALLDNLSIRDKMLVRLGMHTGLRISDLLELKVSDIKENMEIKEKKTGKTKRFRLPSDFLDELNSYIDTFCTDWLFPSKKGTPLGYQRAYQIIKKAAEKAGIPNVGTHTMRKTFGYFAYHVHKVPLAHLMEALNHSSESHTLRYIGITTEMLNDTIYGKMEF